MQDAVVRVVDVQVNVVIRVPPMTALANGVGKLAEREDIRRLLQAQAVVGRQRLVGRHFRGDIV